MKCLNVLVFLFLSAALSASEPVSILTVAQHNRLRQLQEEYAKLQKQRDVDVKKGVAKPLLGAQDNDPASKLHIPATLSLIHRSQVTEVTVVG